MNRVSIGVLSFLAVACTADDPPVEPSESRELRGPESLEACPEVDFSPCDIATARCRKRLLDVACCVFECAEDAPSIATELIDMAEWERRLLEGGDEPSDEVNPIEGVLDTLGLVARGGLSPEAATDYYVDNILGYYDGDTKRITVIEQPGGDDFDGSSVFVHEAIHALQDREHDLTALGEAVESIDENLALSTAVEGEARFHEYRVMLAMQGLREADVNLGMATASARQFAVEWLLMQDEPYLPSLAVLRYALGADWARRTWERDGARGLRNVLDSPPPSTLHVLEQVLDGEPGAPGGLVFPEALELNSEESELAFSGRMGPWLPYLLCRRASPEDDATARSVALSYTGDLLSVVALPEGTIAWRWDFVFGGDAARGAFQTCLMEHDVGLLGAGETLIVTNQDAPDWLLP